MRNQGAVVIDPSTLRCRRLRRARLTVLLYEFKAGLNAYLSAGSARRGPVACRCHPLQRATSQPRDAVFRAGTVHRGAGEGAVDRRRVSQEPADDRRRRERDRRRSSTPSVSRRSSLPRWAGRTTDLVSGDHFGGGSSTPAAVAGYPNITVPAGQVMGLPVGLSFFGRAWTEPALIRIAYAFEQATKHRQTPTFLPTLNA